MSPPQTGVGFPEGMLTLTPQLWWAPLDPLPITCFPTQKKSEVGGHCCLDAILGPPSGEMLGSGPHPQSSLRSPPYHQEAGASFPVHSSCPSANFPLKFSCTGAKLGVCGTKA